MRPLALLLLLGCGSTDPTEGRLPALGDYHITGYWTVPSGLGGELRGNVDGTIRVTAIVGDEFTAEGAGGTMHAGDPAHVIGWNVDAWAVHIDLNGTSSNVLQLRLAPGFASCTGSVRHPSNGTRPLIDCEISKVTP